MTTELCDDLINFSFDDLHAAFKNYQTQHPDDIDGMIFHFFPRFLECIKQLVCHDFCTCILCILIFTHFVIQPLAFSEADHICRTLQAHFDRMLCDVLEKYHSFPGFTLLLGSLCQYVSIKQPHTLVAGIVVSSYLIQQQGEGRTLDNRRLFGDNRIISRNGAIYLLLNTPQFFSYLTKFLESPERSGTHIFDQQQYATASKECLQLFLCSHHNFPRGATEFACHNKAMRRSKPWEWVVRLGVHRRIRDKRRHFTLLQRRSIDALGSIIYQHHPFPESSPEHQYCRFLSYRWALDLLPFLLEKSAISLELAHILHRRTFTMMAQKFPWRRKLAKEAITRYLLRAESVAGEA